MKDIWYSYDQLSKGNYSSIKQVLERCRVLSSSPISQKKRFYHTLFFSSWSGLQPGTPANRCHGDRSMCDLPHCATPMRQNEANIVREERWHQLLPQVLRCTVQAAVGFLLKSCSILALLGDLVKGECLMPTSVALTEIQCKTVETFQLFSYGLQGRLKSFLSSVLLKAAFILWS